jgi:hypothetical protein
MVWPVKTHPAHSTGLECKRISSAGEGCSLDFPFYRTDISTRFHETSVLPVSRSKHRVPQHLGKCIDDLRYRFSNN